MLFKSVVAFHIEKNWLPGGFLGVDIFFVISGFLICQVIFSIIGPDGKTVTLNKRADVPDNGQMLAPDMSPTQPHTTSRIARTCESCHSNPKAIGYGITDGQYMNGQDKDLRLDIQDLKTKEFATENTALQIKAIPRLEHDLSQVVTRDGKQL